MSSETNHKPRCQFWSVEIEKRPAAPILRERKHTNDDIEEYIILMPALVMTLDESPI